MESFIDLAKKRRSIRTYTEEELSQDEVVELMKVALLAPSSKSVRPWQFILVDDKTLLHQLSECKPAGSQLVAGAPLAVVVVADPLLSDVWIEDASVASTMLLLQAEDMGLGACWVQVRNRMGQDGMPAADSIRELLALPEHYEVLSIIAVGHKALERKSVDESKLQWEKLHINRFEER